MIDFVWDWGDRPTGRQKGLYASLNRRIYDSSRHRTFVYPIDFNERITEYPTDLATLDYGFLGGMTAGVRSRIFHYFSQDNKASNTLFKCQGADWGKYFRRNDEADIIKDEYVEFLKRTKFILCPRGYGVGTIRLFETMKAGRVPIVISDDYILPEGPEWSSFALFVREREIHRIPDLVRDNLHQWQRLAQFARREWQRFYSPDFILDHLVSTILEIQESLPERHRLRIMTHQLRFAREVIFEQVRPIIGRARNWIFRK